MSTAIFEERGPGFDEILISRNALNRLWRMASLQESRRDGWVDLAVWEPNYDTSVFLSNSIHPPFAHITLLYNTFSHFTYLYLYLCLCLDLYLGAKLWHIGLFIQQHPSSPFLTINFFFTFFAIVNFKYLCFLSLYVYLSLCFEPYYMQHVNIHPFLARTVLLHNILLPFAVFHDMCLNLFTFFSLLCRVVENMFSFF